ncbi:hypothetical protein JHL18_16930 [Clostridium sp. YIM B02505]|uniref:Uncharacterized protein n=1 Tax=Clostridium yunnanense TaxID=2800325 RepID=A0ABS1ESC6_9CLOT|nr:hypothetical protein [Clostridium yunnanense]MBK1812310.1 hypothetical protein [Clostridium yunnanense]
MKKIKGGYRIAVNEEKKLLFTFSRNTVYVTGMEDYKLLYKYKTISHISSVAINACADRFAVKNTSGKIAVYSFPEGELLGDSEMEHHEGCDIHFMEDGKNILDTDWTGKIMMLNTDTYNHKVLYDFHNKPLNEGRHVDLYFDKYEKKIIATELLTKMAYIADLSEPLVFEQIKIDSIVNFRQIRDSFIICSSCYLQYGVMPNEGYYLVKLDKDFKMKSKKEYDGIEKVILSINEKYMFIKISEEIDEFKSKDKGLLYNHETGELIKEYDVDYISDMEFVDGDRKIIIATWSGSVMDEIG